MRFRLALDALSADAAALAPAILDVGSAGCEVWSESESESESDLVSESDSDSDSDSDGGASLDIAGVCGPSCCETVRRSAEGLSSDSLVNAPDEFRCACVDESVLGGRSGASTKTDDEERRGVLSTGAGGLGEGP